MTPTPPLDHEPKDDVLYVTLDEHLLRQMDDAIGSGLEYAKEVLAIGHPKAEQKAIEEDIEQMEAVIEEMLHRNITLALYPEIADIIPIK